MNNCRVILKKSDDHDLQQLPAAGRSDVEMAYLAGLGVSQQRRADRVANGVPDVGVVDSVFLALSAILTLVKRSLTNCVCQSMPDNISWHHRWRPRRRTWVPSHPSRRGDTVGVRLAPTSGPLEATLILEPLTTCEFIGRREVETGAHRAHAPL